MQADKIEVKQQILQKTTNPHKQQTPQNNGNPNNHQGQNKKTDGTKT